MARIRRAQVRDVGGSRTIGLFVTLSTVVVLGAAMLASQQPGPSATYTAAQAEAGKAAYEVNCEGCHRPDLMGEQDAKPLTGSTFLNAWRGRTSADLFIRIDKTMPPDTPGSAGEEDNFNITAFILQFNKVPAGTIPLTPESAVPLPEVKPASDKK